MGKWEIVRSTVRLCEFFNDTYGVCEKDGEEIDTDCSGDTQRCDNE